MPAPQTLWLARHANREDFVDPNWSATADRPHDPGLSSDGMEQAHQLARRVAALDVDQIVASPFLRAVQTAHLAAEAADHSLLVEPGLGEWQNPNWFETRADPLDASTLATRFERMKLGRDPCLVPKFPETKQDAFERLGTAVACLLDQYPSATLLLVGHGITVYGVLQHLVPGPVPDEGCPLASLTQVENRGTKWHLVKRNDIHHLEGGARQTDRIA